MGALDGLKVADFSWVGAGPRATKDLADNGATVIKVESRKRLDLGRRSPPFAGNARADHDASVFFAQTNTSKMSVSINLSDPDGADVALKLVAWADVVVENFGPGFMERIGLGYDKLRAVNPNVIFASVSVAGKTGPMAGFRGYGNSAAAHSGHADMSGWPDSPPHMPPFAYGDVVAPMFLTVAILSALEERARMGQGCHVDVSQIEPMVHVIADLFADPPEEKPANHDPLMAPHGIFPCKGDDAWIAIAVETDTQWRGLCQVMGNDLEGAQFADGAGRKALEHQLNTALADLTRKHDCLALAQQLVAAGVPASPVMDGRMLSESDALTAAGHWVTVDHPVIGPAAMPAPPMTFSDTPHAVGPSPLLGQHDSHVFEDILGLDPADVARLRAAEALV